MYVSDVLRTSLCAFILVFLLWCVQYHWRRRHLYRLASKRPGPFSFPIIGNGLLFLGSSSNFLDRMMSLAKRYKSPMRIWLGPELIFVVYGAKDVETILNSPNALNKANFYNYWKPVLGSGLLVAPVPIWRPHRKIIMPRFNQRLLNNYVDVFVEQSKVLIEQLEGKVGEGEFDVFHYVGRCTLDITCETNMGLSIQAQTTNSNYLKWTDKAMEIIFVRMFNVLYYFDFIFNLSPYAQEFIDNVAKMHNFTDSVISEKRKSYRTEIEMEATESVTMKPFLQFLMELSEEGVNFSDKELRDEVITFLIAGSETTATLVSSVFLMFGIHPDVQERAYEEVMEVLGPVRSVDHTDLNKFPFLERVIRETMRVLPVLPVMVRKIAQDIKLGTYLQSRFLSNVCSIAEECTVPAGCSVAVPILALHMDAEVWPQPLTFDPDRFLPEEASKRHSYSWLPFSAGPRDCLGSRYANMATKAILATVIRKYRFTSGYKSVEDIKLKVDVTMKPIDGYNVSLELRE